MTISYVQMKEAYKNLLCEFNRKSAAKVLLDEDANKAELIVALSSYRKYLSLTTADC